MSVASLEICGVEFLAEYEFTITAHGNPGSRPTLEHPGDAPEPAEFDIEVHSLRFDDAKQPAELEMPKWLKETIETHLHDRADIVEIVQEADSDDDGGDPDRYRD